MRMRMREDLFSDAELPDVILGLSEAEVIVQDCLRRVGMSHVPVKTGWYKFPGGATMGMAITKEVPVPDEYRAVVLLSPAHFKILRFEFCREVVVHEIAHIITDIKNNRECGHSAEWSRMMRKFGAIPRTVMPAEAFLVPVYS